jgi:16S rRNA (cytidine1402-2'-O)-methyltransferase
MNAAAGSLALVSTPIGNLGDMTHRAIETLGAVDLILAEDTRHSRRLLAHYGITTHVTAYHDHNKERVTPDLVARMAAGERLALITDAGTPGVSDPGFYLVRAAVAAGVTVTAIPGPSALLPALVLSGLATDSFAFEGFTPRKKGELARAMAALAEEPRTTLFYVAPHQLQKVLDAVAEALPGRRVAVARELTKIHEEVVRGTAEEVRDAFAARAVRGEIVLVIDGVGWRAARGARAKDA